MSTSQPQPPPSNFQGRLRQALESLTTAGGDGNRLMISHGDYYMLVFGARGSSALEVEVVANQFLQRPAQLTPGRLEVVTQKGFSAQVRNRANLHRRYDLAVQNAGDGLIGEVEDIFARAFGCEKLEQANIELALQDSEKTANPDLRRAMKQLARVRDHNARQQVYRALLVAELLLIVGPDAEVPHQVEELSGYPVYAVFSDYTSLRLWQPLGHSYRRVSGHVLFPELLPQKIGSLLINPKGTIGGELYRNEVAGLAAAASRYRR